VEFLVGFDVTVPDGAPESEIEERLAAEASGATGLARQGHLVRLWKRPSRQTGGTFAGPRISGKLLPGASADWQTVLADGTALGDIRYTLQTDAGGVLYVQSRRVRHGSADVLARLGRGEPVDTSEYTFRTSTRSGRQRLSSIG
jgi:Protein of unknown function (DUF3237)/Muconolactone delta-isomerase